jgi:pyridoxal biosynthesis lyase PdxS
MAENRQELNRNLAQMLKGGVIMDVTTPEQAKIAEAAGIYTSKQTDCCPGRVSKHPGNR